MQKYTSFLLILFLVSCSAYHSGYYHKPQLYCRLCNDISTAELITINSNGVAYYKIELFIDVWISGDYEKAMDMFISMNNGEWIRLQKYPINKRIHISKTIMIRKFNSSFLMKIKLKAVLIDLDDKELILVKEFGLRGYMPKLIR